VIISYRGRSSPDSTQPDAQTNALEPFATVLLLQAPAVNRFDVESPVAAHLKRRYLTLLQELVDRGGMHVQVFRYLAHGHHSGRHRFGGRSGSIFLFHLSFSLNSKVAEVFTLFVKLAR